MNISPKISVITPCYNHESYVSDFIESILNQTYKNFEIIIVDDFSTDNSVQKIQKYTDSRIKLIKHDFNQGTNAALNTAYKYVTGDIIVFCASDDMIKNNYFEKIIDVFKNNKQTGVIYSSLLIINENSTPINPQPEWHILKKMDRFETLNKLFFIGNILLSAGMAVRKEFVDNIMPLDLSLVNQQDYNIHINILLQTDLQILTTPFIYYRRMKNNSNLSAYEYKTFLREKMEMPRAMNSFIKIKDLKLLNNIFPDNDFKHKELIPYYLGLLALENSCSFEKKMWGYHLIMDFISEFSNYKLLHELEGFNFSKYLNLIFMFKEKFNEDKILKKYKKYKKLFNIFIYINCLLIILLLVGLYVFIS